MKELSESQAQFVDQFGTLFEGEGMPRIAGRILAWLILCDPPEQSANDLASLLNISGGSANTMVRMLETVGYVEHTGVPGSRRKLYRLKPNVWLNTLKGRMPWMTLFRQLAETGLDSVEPLPERSEASLTEMRDLYQFLEERFPKLLQEWEEGRA